MAWFTLNQSHHRHRYRDDSPKRYASSRRSWRGGPRRSRVVSWSFCILILLIIVFWPSRRGDAQIKPKLQPKRSPKLSTKDRNSWRPPVDTPRNEQVRQKKPRTLVKLEEHTYRTDGLLDVNPKGRHPILDLITRSERLWREKVEGQSRNFKQAVDEYRRRYQRAPPKGFEIWWDYVDFHDVKLVDEYDSIHARLEPFWGVDPRALRAIQTEWEAQSDTFTIGKVGGGDLVLLNETIHGARMGHERVKHQLNMLEDVQEWLPDFRATFTMHDGPRQFTSWELRSRAEEAAAVGEYIDVERVAASIRGTGWASACPPTAPIHTYTPPLTPTSPTAVKKTFIHDHRRSMDPCLHPSHLILNGFLSQYHKGPTPQKRLIPTFSICASSLHSDILTVAAEQFEDDLVGDPGWAEKPDERLLWRGSNTGILHQDGNKWNISQRIRLVETTTRRGGTMRVLMPSRGEESESVPVGDGVDVRTSLMNPAFMDVAFTRKPLQCRAPVCEKLKHMFEWRENQSWQDSWQYKYIMDVDGNGWSARFKRLLTSNSLIFKSTIFPEWYTERIMPWVHYIPIQLDLSDLYDALAFFRGDLSGEGAHDHLAEKIASAGKQWSETFYRREDMTAYHFRLFLEYARVMSEDREAMSYHEGDSEDI